MAAGRIGAVRRTVNEITMELIPAHSDSESLFVLVAQDGSPILSISAKGKIEFGVEPTEAARVFADELERILKLRFPHCVKNEAVETGFAPSQAGRK